MWGEENGKGKEEMGNLLGNPMQNDYYNATNTYQYVREAINIMNPAPKK